MVSWHIVTSAAYKAGSKVDGDMYFLSDTHEIYRGSESFSEAVVMYTDLPVEAIAKNKLYINNCKRLRFPKSFFAFNLNEFTYLSSGKGFSKNQI